MYWVGGVGVDMLLNVYNTINIYIGAQALGRLTGVNADSDQFHVDFKEVRFRLRRDSASGGVFFGIT